MRNNNSVWVAVTQKHHHPPLPITHLLVLLLLQEESNIIIETVRGFAEAEIREGARDADESGKLPESAIAQAHELGLVSNGLPEAHGGGGERSAVTTALIAEELAWGDLAIALGALSPSTPIYQPPRIMSVRSGLRRARPIR